VSSLRPAIGGNRLRFIVILGALTAFAPLSIDMYLPAFPAIEAHFGVGPGAVQATLAVFFVGLAVGQGFYGPIADRYGRRGPLVAGIALYVVASALAAFAPDVGTLTLARLAQALGGCAGIVIARAMVRDLFHEREAARVYSHLMLVMGVAPILAPVLGAYVLEVAGWSAIFWVLSGFGVLCIAAVTFGLPETLPAERRTSDGVGGALRGYAALCADRPFMGLAFCSAFASGSLFAYITASPFVFISLHGVSATTFSILFGANAFGLILSSQINAALLRRFTSRQILGIAGLANAVAGLGLAAVALTAPGWFAGFVVLLFLFVGSLGFLFPNAVATAMARAQTRAGGASALIGMLQFLLGALAAALVGQIGEGSALPMALVMVVASVAGLISGRAGGASPQGTL
jgi:DHA1 family bicyclomycin/chloramphenicol resistance-like MFS transporter